MACIQHFSHDQNECSVFLNAALCVVDTLQNSLLKFIIEMKMEKLKVSQNCTEFLVQHLVSITAGINASF